MESVLYAKLAETTNPLIHFDIRQLVLTALPQTNGSPFLFESRCDLFVAGVTNQISLPVSILPLSETELRVATKTSLRMSAFGIVVPFHIDGTNETIRVADEVKVSLEWFAKRNSAR